MFSVIAPWQSFLPWSGLYIMDCHEIIIACLWTNQLVEAEGNYFLRVLLSAHRTFVSDNGHKGWGEGCNTTQGKLWFLLFVVKVSTNHLPTTLFHFFPASLFFVTYCVIRNILVWLGGCFSFQCFSSVFHRILRSSVQKTRKKSPAHHKKARCYGKIYSVNTEEWR